MVIDSSALIAILEQGPDAERFARSIKEADRRLISTGTVLETSLVIEVRRGPDGSDKLDVLLSTAQIEIVPFSAEHLALARLAFRRFGRGRHPAGLNFGDCISYALAKSSGEKLLFKGTDFTQTNILAA
jgi:ribonuclease VapC